jgi:hypothetical protein
MRCQSAFSTLMTKTGGRMIDASEMEKAAMRACLLPLGGYVGSIGMERPLADYSQEEVLMLIDIVVCAYQDYMLEEHERLAEQDRQFLEERLSRQQSTNTKGAMF